MDDAFTVGGVERVGNLSAQLQQQLNFQRLAHDAVLQGFAVEKLHGDKSPAVFFADVVDGADIGMVQRRRRFGFAAKSFQSLAILGQIFGQEFKRHEAVEPYVLGLIDHAHPAPAQLLDDAVMRDGLADHWQRILTWGKAASQ